MAMERMPEQPKKITAILNKQTLLILIGALSAVLAILLIVCFMVLPPDNPQPTEPMLNSTPASSSSVPTTPTTLPTLPSTAPLPTQPPVPPEGGKYINVGGGYLAEVIQTDVETFDGGKIDDYSHPTNNYLPKGTVDYCAKEIVYGSGLRYVQLRSGHRVYYDKRVYPFPEEPVAQMIKEVKQYEGWLPDHNEVGLASFEVDGRHTVLTLNTDWKAPFYFETNQSGYAKPDGGKERDYAIVGNNITYVDITFCYATVFTGNVTIPVNHPLFRSAELIKNDYDCTLRLYLRKTGGFYGWQAYYNENDQLCFQFLNPAKVSGADNKYGVDLNGALVLIDVGHGGVDGGAAAYHCATCDVDLMAPDLKSNKCPTCKTKPELVATESQLNMSLALALKAELESVGATVVFNRTEDTNLNVNDRQANLLEVAPDICIAVHQNSNDSSSVRGFFSMYYTPWSHLLSKYIRENTREAGVYTRHILQWSAAYFMCRQPVCPTVLTENGFMSSPEDLADMVNPEVVTAKAETITQGVVDYFLAINS